MIVISRANNSTHRDKNWGDDARNPGIFTQPVRGPLLKANPLALVHKTELENPLISYDPTIQLHLSTKKITENGYNSNGFVNNKFINLLMLKLNFLTKT